MNFDLSEEQSLLQASIARFVQNQYDLERRRGYLANPEGFDAGNYASLAELGALLINIPEEAGGLGGSAVDIMVAMEALGPGLIAEPVFTNAIFAAELLKRCGADTAHLEAIASGEVRFAVAHAERAGRFALDYVATKAARKGEGYTLSGEKTLVLNGTAETHLLVLARTSGDVQGAAGLSLFHVAPGSAGLDLRSYRTADSNIAAEIALRNTPATLIGPKDGAFALFEEAVAVASFALCAEAVGVMQAMFDETLEYVKTRKQFGKPIGSFQVIQHRMSDGYMMLEQCRSIVLKAALADPSDRAGYLKTIAGMKALVAEKSTKLGHECIQFHGGMGVTDELIISHYHKRLQMIATLFGDAKTQIARYAAAA